MNDETNGMRRPLTGQVVSWLTMVTGNDQPHRFVLEAIDPQTECVAVEAKLQVSELPELLDLLDRDAAEVIVAGAGCDLESDEVTKLKVRFNVAFEPGDRAERLRPASRLDDLPYLVHTGRELALMLEGSKPLAVFSGAYPPIPNREDIPERLFGPHVEAGRFVKSERVLKPDLQSDSSGKSGTATRVVLYALPHQAWRIDAYLMLQDTAGKSGWSEEFERTQGSLLGYEDWQNDIFIEQCYRPAVRSRRTS